MQVAGYMEHNPAYILTSGSLHVREVEEIGICELNNRCHIVANGVWTIQDINIKTYVDNQNNCTLILNINWFISKKYTKRLKALQRIIRLFHI